MLRGPPVHTVLQQMSAPAAPLTDGHPGSQHFCVWGGAMLLLLTSPESHK